VYPDPDRGARAAQLPVSRGAATSVAPVARRRGRVRWRQRAPPGWAGESRLIHRRRFSRDGDDPS